MEYDKAVADYSEAIRLKPDYAEAFYDRGHAYEQKGDYGKAEVDCVQARKLGYSGNRRLTEANQCERVRSRWW